MKSSSARTVPPVASYGASSFSPKHLEVLREGMKLIAERGYRGASLRELARRVGMQQPSLYHYFASKEELLDQVLVTFGFGAIAPPPEQLPERVEDLPAVLASTVRWLFSSTDWPHFVRLLFGVAGDVPKLQPRLRTMMVEATQAQMRAATEPYVASGQIAAADAEHLVRLVSSAIGLPLIEQHMLFPKAAGREDLDAYVEFVVRFTSDAIRNGTLKPSSPKQTQRRR